MRFHCRQEKKNLILLRASKAKMLNIWPLGGTHTEKEGPNEGRYTRDNK